MLKQDQKNLIGVVVCGFTLIAAGVVIKPNMSLTPNTTHPESMTDLRAVSPQSREHVGTSFPGTSRLDFPLSTQAKNFAFRVNEAVVSEENVILILEIENTGGASVLQLGVDGRNAKSILTFGQHQIVCGRAQFEGTWYENYLELDTQPRGKYLVNMVFKTTTEVIREETTLNLHGLEKLAGGEFSPLAVKLSH